MRSSGSGSIHGGDSSLLNQILLEVFGISEPLDFRQLYPMWVIIIANGFIGASFAMIILTSAIPQHTGPPVPRRTL